MTTIHKYLLDLAEYQEVEMPSGARILTAQVQAGDIFLWAKVFTDAPDEQRQIHMYGTGQKLPEMTKLMYLGTVQMGAFVWHIFEEPK